MKKVLITIMVAIFTLFSLTVVFAENSATFTDVSKDKWYYDSVMYVAEKNIMKGVKSDLFKPGDSVTRAQLVTTLYRLEGEPEVDTAAGFKDVKDGAWYGPAVAWANENEIVNGYSDGSFKPNQPIIREQVAAIFYRYMNYAGESFTGDFGFKTTFYDTTEASDYAVDPIYWMVFKGILEGSNNYFKPKEVTTRAQLASILTKYLKQKESRTEDEDQVRAEKIVASMSLEEKIGQMIMVDMRQYGSESDKTYVTELNGPLKQAIKDYDFGGIILFAQNITGVEQTTRLISQMQAASETPLLIGVDQEGGRVVRTAVATGFGGNMSLAATGDTSLAWAAATVIGKEMSAMGFNVDFAPCMDINTNPDNPVIGTRSFSDDPETASDYGTAFIKGLHDGGIATAIKHFPGHGDTSTDSHTGLPLVDKYYDEIACNELIPFYSGVEAGTDMIMTAHIQFPKIEKDTYVSKLDGSIVGIPATLSDDIITGIVRNKMGFDGVVIADAMEMEAIHSHFDSRDAARMAINADVDILLMPVNISTEAGIEEMGDYISDIVDMVEAGEIDVAEIDDSATRIIKMKIKRGIWDAEDENVDAKVSAAKKIVGCQDHRDLEWIVAQKAVTLVKDDETLPFKADEINNLGIFFPNAGEVTMLDSSLARMKSDGTITDDMSINDYTFGGMTDEAIAAAVEENDVIVVVSEMGSPSYLDSSTNAGKIGTTAQKIIAVAKELGKKTVVISANLPYDVALFGEADSIICTYCCKTSSCAVGAGLASLFKNPSEITGKLPVKIGVNFGV